MRSGCRSTSVLYAWRDVGFPFTDNQPQSAAWWLKMFGIFSSAREPTRALSPDCALLWRAPETRHPRAQFKTSDYAKTSLKYSSQSLGNIIEGYLDERLSFPCVIDFNIALNGRKWSDNGNYWLNCTVNWHCVLHGQLGLCVRHEGGEFAGCVLCIMDHIKQFTKYIYRSWLNILANYLKRWRIKNGYNGLLFC